MPRLALTLWLLLGGESVWAASSDDNFWLPVSYREWLGEMRDEAKALEQSNPECLQVIRAALQENQSTIEHPVFRLVCRDADNSSFSVVVDAISHEQTYANPMRSPVYRAQKAEEERQLAEQQAEAERLQREQQAEEERQAQLIAAQARLQSMRLQCDQVFQQQIRFMHKFSWVGDGFGELQQLLPVEEESAETTTAVADTVASAEPSPEPPIAKSTAQTESQPEQQPEEQPEKPQSEEQIQRLIERAEREAKAAAAKGPAIVEPAPVPVEEPVAPAVAATDSTPETETEPEPVAPVKAPEVWFVEGDFDAEDPYGRPLQYQVRCTIPEAGDVIVKISSRRLSAKP